MNHKDTKDTKKDSMNARAEGTTKAVIGAAIEVHRALGPGSLVSVYEQALAVELEMRGGSLRPSLLPVDSEQRLGIGVATV